VVLHTVRGTFAELMAERLGVTEPETSRILGTRENDLWDLDELNDDQFFTFVLTELNLPMSMKPVLEKFVVDDFYIDQDMLAAIHDFHKTYKTALLTNFPAHVHDFLRTAWRVDGAFDHIIASCDVKLIKPDPRIYLLTLERLGCAPEEAVFIDDREANVKAARKLGIHGVVFQTKTQTLGDIQTILSKNS
jgi:putative hydrolase of the HAD superfamily